MSNQLNNPKNLAALLNSTPASIQKSTTLWAVCTKGKTDKSVKMMLGDPTEWAEIPISELESYAEIDLLKIEGKYYNLLELTFKPNKENAIWLQIISFLIERGGIFAGQCKASNCGCGCSHSNENGGQTMQSFAQTSNSRKRARACRAIAWAIPFISADTAYKVCDRLE